MKTLSEDPAGSDYQRIARAIDYIRRHRQQQPELQVIADQVGLSPFHFQRLFVRWAGVSPKRFLSFLTVEHAKARLREQASVLQTALDVGLSGPGRLHDQFVTLEAMTPGEYKTQGAGLQIEYSFHATPFGLTGQLMTRRGLCGLRFLEDSPAARSAFIDEAASEWPQSRLVEAAAADNLLQHWLAGQVPLEQPLSLLVKGTPFQVQVWRALLQVPEGQLWGYRDLASALGRPSAARAVGSAIGANPIGYLIPCHRVLRGDGSFSGYRWGVERKMAMVGWEAARRSG